MRLLDWLNANGPAVQAIGTLALIAVTAWYACITSRIARAAVRQASTSELAFRAELQTRVATVRTAASHILSIVALLRVGETLPNTESSGEWQQRWLDLERACRALEDDQVHAAIDAALEAKRRWDVAEAAGWDDHATFREVAQGIVVPLARLASLYQRRQHDPESVASLTEATRAAYRHCSRRPAELTRRGRG